MKVLVVFTLTLFLSSCVAIKESISYRNVFKKLASIDYDFNKKEVVKYGDHNKEYFIFYEPKVVIHSDIIYFIHGGGWRSGSPEEFEYIAYYFNNLGYRVVLTAYPLISDVNSSQMSKSILNSYLHMYNRYVVNHEKVILGGASAGAHLAISLFLDNYYLIEFEKSVSKIFSISGVLDFNSCENFFINKLINNLTEKDKELKFKLNPFNKLDKSKFFDTYLIYSTIDGVVEFENSISFGNKAAKFGSNVKYLEFNHYTHDESYTYPFIEDSIMLTDFKNWLIKK